MNQEIAKKLVLKGNKINLKHVNVTEDSQLKFANQSYSIIKIFCNQSSKNDWVNSILEFVVKQVEKLFPGKHKDKQVSEYLSVLGMHKLSPEIELYNFLYE